MWPAGHLSLLGASSATVSFKNLLQEYTQKLKLSLPRYTTEPTAVGFKSKVSVQRPSKETVIFTGEEQSVKKAAEQDAARIACIELNLLGSWWSELFLEIIISDLFNNFFNIGTAVNIFFYLHELFYLSVLFFGLLYMHYWPVTSLQCVVLGVHYTCVLVKAVYENLKAHAISPIKSMCTSWLWKTKYSAHIVQGRQCKMYAYGTVSSFAWMSKSILPWCSKFTHHVGHI